MKIEMKLYKNRTECCTFNAIDFANLNIVNCIIKTLYKVFFIRLSFTIIVLLFYQSYVLFHL